MLVHVFLSAVVLAASSPQDTFFDVLSRLAGSDARECGTVRLDSDASTALQCAKEHHSSGTSFWIALQIQGVDSYLWIGAAQADDGSRWLVDFDSDVTGGRSKKPLMRVIPCGEFEVSLDDEKRLVACRRAWKD